MGLAADEGRWRACREQRVQFAVAQHADQRAVVADRFEVEAGDRLERRAFAPARLLLAAAAPVDFLRRDAVLVLEHAAHPHHRGDLVFGQADALAAQVGWRRDAGVAANVHAGMAEDARHEGRDRDISGRSRRHRAQIAAEGKFADVEFLVAEGAEENLLGIERQTRYRASLDPHPPVDDRPGPIVVAACNGYRNVDHQPSL